MGSSSQTTNTKTSNTYNTNTVNHDVEKITDNNNYKEHDRVTNNHNGNTYKHGFTDLTGMKNEGSQSFDLSAGLMNLNQLGATAAIVTTPEKAVALLNLNANLEQPYQVKGAYLI